jgi:hypothetical protein
MVRISCNLRQLRRPIVRRAVGVGACQASRSWCRRCTAGAPYDDDLDDNTIIMMTMMLVLVSGISELVGALHGRGTSVYLVSGGFRIVRKPS